ETIQTSGEALLSILNDILDFSKIDAGLMEIKTREFNPNHLIEHVVKLFSSKVENNGSLMLMTQGIPLLTHRLMGDVDHLHQVLVNLLSNAVKFTEQGDIILSVTQQAETQDAMVLRFQVKDTGTGIASKDQTHLFHAFTQVDSSHQRKHGGTGLGLSIVKRLVDLMGSQIQLHSTLGQGSTFFFDINLKKSASPNTGGAIDYLPYFSQWSILLIDHHSTHRNMLQHLLQAWGIHCTSHSAADKAQQALSQIHYDMVFASQEVIDRNQQLSQSIQHSSAKFIMMIQNNSPMDIELREQYGLSGFMRKPIFIRSLCETLLSVMGLKERKSIVTHQNITSQRNEYILLAEDNLVNQRVVLAMLERQGFEHIDVVGDGLEAVQYAQERQYSLILMDVQMPHMDGLSACREIRTLESMQDLPHTPILALTAHALEEDRQESLRAGMNDHLTKPLTGKRLQEALARWLPYTPSNHVEKVKEKTQHLTLHENKDSPVDRQLLCQLQQDIGLGLGMILDAYIQSLPKHVEAMRQAIADNDADALRRCGHKLKGSSRSVAALHLGELAYQIELLGETSELESASHRVDELEDVIQQVIAVLEEDWVQALR
ncbi:MAG: response regulator, partial [Mariprofundaceae bacterium]|nr:response regulator [Mariprofundaceae bacterium]